AAILGGFALLAVALLMRERSLGRFEPVQSEGVDADWIRTHIVAQPAEVIGAAWDQDVGKDEVAALIARLISEGKLTGGVASGVLTLELKVDRTSLQGYERALVDGLFFEGRTSTSTDAIRNHYEGQGFDPAKIIAPGLGERVRDFLPKGK